ncbi:ABC transporter ATP-binding protein [Pseudoxanthomonas sangjuensis]|uniref:ATP-binding cassette domain-containing protein n=1 Tax=Pseudoxanthomonas sangjuensis TaxID=1503750 RepID=UPI0013920463|nr:ABC transporter ATP-binding protein [Pseudoxanthomonas sangjuensis]KAF1714531.1 ABC transporter ATP-binding protein [Pseudoxanthomonas sangjuensis]
MPCSDSSADEGRIVLRAFAGTLTGRDWLQVAAYVLASLLAAFAGSLAALFLVPLIQPGPVLPFGGGILGSPGSLEADAALFAAAAGLFALSRWSAACLGARLAARYGMFLRRRVHARLVRAKLAALADSTSAEIANVLTYNVEIIVNGFNALLQLLVAVLTTVVTLAFAFWVSPPLVLALPAFAALAWMATSLFGREQSRIGRRYVADMTRLFWRGEDFPRRLRHVRSFGRQQADHAAYADMAAQLGRGYRRRLELAAHGRLLLELLATAMIAAAFVLAHRWHGIDQAALVAVSLLLGRLLPYLALTRQGVQQLRSAMPAFELWQRYVSLEADRTPRAHDADGDLPALRIRRMRLPRSLVSLEVRDLSLAPGELTLVCGGSGIGKSCLVDILSGMMAPAEFEADIAGQEIGFDRYRALVGRSAYVSQQVRPWHASVRESLLWAAPEASEALMWSALADVGLDKRLHRSGYGLDTALQDSTSRFSGGELQRLLLAQVLLRKPTLAILDEATGALDTASEREVLSTLRIRLPRTALVVVSHRTGLATMADQSLEIDGSGVAAAVRHRQSAEPGHGPAALALEP